MSETVTISRAEYQDLIDARDANAAMRDIASGAMETLTQTEVEAYLAASSALAFWRKKRGLTQAALAAEAGVSQPYFAQIESGKRSPDVQFWLKIARRLNLRVEDIAPDKDAD